MTRFEKIECFAIGEMHPLFKGLAWTASARSEDENRFALMHVFVERDGEEWHMVATDGRRLHHAIYDAGMFSDDLDMLTPGLWEVIIKNSKVIVVAEADIDASEFPAWRKLLPDPQPFFRDAVMVSSTSKIGIRTGALLNSDFVSDAVGFGTVFKKNESTNIEYFAVPNGVVCIKNDVGTAIIQPMTIEEMEASEPKDTGTMPLPGLEESPMGNLAKAMDTGNSLTVKIDGKTARKLVKTLKGVKEVKPDADGEEEA